MPWTLHHDQVFTAAAKAVARTSFYLRWGLCHLVPMSLFGLLGLFALIPQHSEATLVVYIVLVTVAITISTVIVSVLAFIYTGILPDESSSKANDRQNAVMHLKEKFRQYGTDLLRIYSQHEPLGLAIASSIDFPHLRRLISRRACDNYSEFIVNDLQEAAEYIANPRENFPHKPFLHLYLAELQRGNLPELNVRSRSASCVARPLSPSGSRSATLLDIAPDE
jgi:hypothetical protein